MVCSTNPSSRSLSVKGARLVRSEARRSQPMSQDSVFNHDCPQFVLAWLLLLRSHLTIERGIQRQRAIKFNQTKDLGQWEEMSRINLNDA